MWFRDDIRNILLGLEIASAHPTAYFNDSEMDAYRAGFRAAIIASAASFGILIAESDLRRLTPLRVPKLVEGGGPPAQR
jgi:hypothetical protein